MPHILIVEDDVSARAALGELVSAEGFTTAQAGSLRDARIQISRHSPDAVLIDLVLPDGNGMDLMEDIPSHSGTEIIVMTGHASVETAVEALRMGAADYLVKPVNFQRLKSILARIPRPGDLKAEIGNLRGELRRLGLFGQMLGNSPAMQTLYDQVSRVAPTEATVLLIGESGTGKELAAQTIHDLSLRRKQPFLPVNCGAISPNLIESEMFGHERGSFTGADRQHKGYFERANGGTLLLDEITEMPVELQVKLLRVLETGVFMRVGTNREIDTDVRVIAATNRDPEEAVADGKLRADLYHRLNVFPLQLPPLRERGKDVELLAQHFLDQLNAQNNSKKTFLPQAMDTLRAYNWPGNVRELRNYVQRAYIMADDTGISTEAVPLQISTTQASSGSTLTIPVGTSLASADKKIILATLEQCGGVKKRAAELLGISLKTLYNRLEEYGNGSNSNSEGENGKAQTTEA
ncbi:sigma-54-dependent transcriptional regulator (plasmid) [Ralstonia syzygii subsp. celebesensis]|uniref:Sigma-54-dependent Fis family transcriptional regulator n=3 Tax=Ralstonia solanacearum species complex TaxID=3116862 RepID=A0AAD0WIX0_RALSL|nr:MULTISPECIES: sigma-54 dependent transcriptional regulator [Ralstonia solanacearum species complex]CCA83658.1 response regulator in two-component reguatory system (EBP family) [blood disease bacterium R229]AQW32614.1 sigma-54-dependent Fis family transcriptional regulator [blood disease bacterium A2-HR MARDI]AXV84663.1 sigma-54-dependent Fis family transcriptional regulator [Ralstonia solanacearum]AXW55786.1 sigma-54-dependent Fis family transcriptional regulator [Ralstonia solanacearum]QQV